MFLRADHTRGQPEQTAFSAAGGHWAKDSGTTGGGRCAEHVRSPEQSWRGEDGGRGAAHRVGSLDSVQVLEWVGACSSHGTSSRAVSTSASVLPAPGAHDAQVGAAPVTTPPSESLWAPLPLGCRNVTRSLSCHLGAQRGAEQSSHSRDAWLKLDFIASCLFWGL